MKCFINPGIARIAVIEVPNPDNRGPDNRGLDNQGLTVVGSVPALHNKNCISFVDLTSFISKLNERVRNKKER